MSTQLLTLDEYNTLAAKMLQKHPKLGKHYVTYDNIGLLTHYLIRADMEYNDQVTGFGGKVASLKTFRNAWFAKIVMRMIVSKKTMKAGRTVSIDDLYARDEYNGRRDTFCVQNYVSEQEYKNKFKELEDLIEEYFAKKPKVNHNRYRKDKNGVLHWSAARPSKHNSAAHHYMKHFYLEGMSYRDIADKYGITTGAVQHRIKTHAKNIDWDKLK